MVAIYLRSIKVSRRKKHGQKRYSYERRQQIAKCGPVLSIDPKEYEKKNPPKDINAYNVASASFLQTYEWRRVRMEALKKYGARCQCCGATPADGVKMHVDHIKPRKVFPELALDVNNLQILCEECNHGKGNWDMTDWRNNLATSC